MRGEGSARHAYEYARRDFENCDEFIERRGFVLFDDSADGSGREVCDLVKEIEAAGECEPVIKNPDYLFRKSRAARVNRGARRPDARQSGPAPALGACFGFCYIVAAANLTDAERDFENICVPFGHEGFPLSTTPPEMEKAEGRARTMVRALVGASR